jgi:hypothetical protein
MSRTIKGWCLGTEGGLWWIVNEEDGELYEFKARDWMCCEMACGLGIKTNFIIGLDWINNDERIIDAYCCERYNIKGLGRNYETFWSKVKGVFRGYK